MRLSHKHAKRLSHVKSRKRLSHKHYHISMQNMLKTGRDYQ